MTEVVGSSWYCRQGNVVAAHSRPFMVSDKVVRAWAIVASKPAPALYLHPDLDGAIVKGIADKRERILDSLTDGLMTKVEAAKRLANLDAIDRSNEAKVRASRVLTSHGVRWTGTEAEQNADLRAIWLRIDLGKDMRPVRGVNILGPATDASPADWAKFEDEEGRREG